MKHDYWKCNNKHCQWIGKTQYNPKSLKKQPCMWCNWHRYETGGYIIKMTKNEIIEYLENELERFFKIKELRHERKNKI